MLERKSITTTPNPLWTCPSCRRQFKNRNQVHSCGLFNVEQLLVGMPREIVELYHRLDQLIRSCGDVVVAPTKTRVLFKVRTVFASVEICKKWLDVVLILDRRLKNSRIRKVQVEYPGTVHFVRIENANDIDADLTIWLQDAYDHRSRKDAEKTKGDRK